MKENERVFKSIGRMFILSTKEDVVSGLGLTKEKIEKESTKYQEMKKVYEKKLGTATEALKEYMGGQK